MGVPSWLAEYRLLGKTDEHACFHVEGQIFAYWLSGRFKRENLEALTRMASTAPEWRQPYVSIVLTEDIDGYDTDLRTMITEPGELADVRAYESIVVSEKPLERMIIQTMALAGKTAGNPAGRLHTETNFAAALEHARGVLARAGR